MANTPVQFKAPTGLTLTLKLYPYGSDTIANGAGDAAAEKTNNKGTYEAIVAEAITGWHDASIVDGSGNVSAAYSVYLEDDTEIKRCHDAADRIWPVEDGAVPPAAAGASGGLIRHTTDLAIASGKAAATVATGDGVDAATLLGLYRPFTGTIISGVAAEIFETSLTGLQAGVLEGQTIVFAAGSGIAGQRATILAYDSATGNVTVPVDELAGQPNIADPFVIIQSQRDVTFAAGAVREAIGLASANLDTQLGGIGTSALTLLGLYRPLTGTVTVGGPAEAFSVSLTGLSVERVVGKTIRMTSGAAAGEDGTIIDYDNATGAVAVVGMTSDVEAGDTFAILMTQRTLFGNVMGEVYTVGATGLTAIAAAVKAALLGFIRLITRKDAATATDNAADLTLINANSGTGAGAYANTTDSLEAAADAGGGLTEDDIADIAEATVAALGGVADINPYTAGTGQSLDLYRGDAYLNSEGRGLTYTRLSTETLWPTTLSTVHFWARPTGPMLKENPLAAALRPILTIATLTSTGTTATATVTGGHSLTTGDMVWVTGAAQNGYNGYYVVTVTGATTITYTVPTGLTTPATGTITAQAGIAQTVTQATGASRAYRLEFTAAQLRTLATDVVMGYTFGVVANGATAPAVLRSGPMNTRPAFG